MRADEEQGCRNGIRGRCRQGHVRAVCVARLIWLRPCLPALEPEFIFFCKTKPTMNICQFSVERHKRNCLPGRLRCVSGEQAPSVVQLAKSFCRTKPIGNYLEVSMRRDDARNNASFFKFKPNEGFRNDFNRVCRNIGHAACNDVPGLRFKTREARVLALHPGYEVLLLVARLVSSFAQSELSRVNT